MTYFIFLIILICLEYFVLSFCISNNETRDNIFLLLSFVQCVLFLGLRSNIIPDTETYFNIYRIIGRQRLDMIFNVVDFEKGYILFNRLIYNIFADNRIVFFSSCAIFSCIPVFFLIKKLNTNKLLPVLIWCIFNGLNTALINIRQSMAIGIILLAYYAILNNKKLLSLILVILASFFHFSSIFLLIIFPLYYISIKIKLSIRNIIIFLLIFVIIFIFSDYMFSFLLENTSTSYNLYLDFYKKNKIGSCIYLILNLIIFFSSWAIYIQNKNLLSNKFIKEKFYLYLLLIGILFYAISIKNGSNRMALYFVSVYIFIIPECFKVISNDKNIKAILLIMLFICFGMVISGMYFLPSSFAIGKYQTIFD